MADQRRAYYVAFVGFPGCLPDSDSGAIEIATRRDLVQFVSDQLDSAGFSQRSRRQVNLARVWQWIQRHGCDSSASFTIGDTQPQSLALVEFRAMSREEFRAMSREEFKACEGVEA